MTEIKRRGLIIIHTGEGKGKTTAAMGIALRAAGHKFKILMMQFIKGTWHYGELDAVKQLYPNFEIVPLGKGFITLGDKMPDPKDIQIVEQGWNYCKERIISGKYDIIILDEINYVIYYKLLPLEKVLNVLKKKPESLHLILTGRSAHPKIIEIADLVTEMKEIKHPFNKGVKAQKGIEF
ncbi:MAG: cob(I)yrinic acid a,c-diamide adenosyltransferase [Thermodesulfobacteriota bacterium]|nr:cob(I)yrinic acid a,c-diamide adenosyltransferase [Thermodesulfobacteriota bacterium]